MNNTTFRAWDKKRNIFLNSLDIGDFCNRYSMSRFRLENLIYEQSFGKKDKNNKEIYEGDIIKCLAQMDTGHEYELIGEVRFEDFEYVIYTTNDKWPCASFKCLTDIEVIGNIHQHAELLK